MDEEKDDYRSKDSEMVRYDFKKSLLNYLTDDDFDDVGCNPLTRI